MNLAPTVVLICARAVAKSFLTSLYGCAVCVLYPNSKVVVTAKLKKTAGLLITEKIEKELRGMSPNLNREIKKVQTNQNSIEVIFHNGSSFIATACNDDARGIRSTVLIVDEFRQCKKEIIDAVFSPMEILRPTPYTMKDEYSHLGEDPREIYLSSAFLKSHWMYQKIKDAVVDMYSNGESILFGTDYAISVKCGIRSISQMLKDKKKFDSMTYDMEYNNMMVGGSADQYYSFEMLSNAQKIKKAWYPKTTEEYFNKKKNRFGDIKRQDGEIRIVSMDIAMSKSTSRIKNDLSVIKCIRALPNGEKYERQEVYTEAFEGKDIDSQAIRTRQIMEDFDATYLVLDGRTYGTNMVDSLGKVLYDEERDKEYIPIKVFNNDELADRCKNPSASPIVWAFIASADLNHKMHTTMKGSLKDGKYKMLISHMECKDEYLSDKKDYKMGTEEERSRYELPYIYSDLSMNEMVNLSQEFVQGGKIKLVEPGNGTKDKYITGAMGNLFIQELEIELTNKYKKSNFDVSALSKFSRPPQIRKY